MAALVATVSVWSCLIVLCGSHRVRSLPDVVFPPVITTHPTSQLVTAHMNFTLNCEATGEGSITYQWETSNLTEGQWVNISNSNNTSLVSNLTDPQQYRCIASNEAGETVSNIANITILKIINPSQNIERVLYVRGSFTFTCTSSVSSNVTFSWTHNGKPITRPHNQTADGGVSILRITGILNSDRGRYMCTVTSGSLSVTALINTIKVHGTPSFQIYPNESMRDVMKGRNITYYCLVKGQRPLVNAWEQSTSTGWITVRHNSQSYTIDTTTLDVGQHVFRCKATNRGGPVVSDNITINVYGPPVVTHHPTSSDVPLKGSVTLMCMASGSKGTLTYSWQRSSGSNWTTVSNDNTTSYTTDATLDIGQYMYRCRVGNEAGSVVSNNATVNVYGPPGINPHLINKFIRVNTTTTLTCVAIGYGIITYYWHKRSLEGSSWMEISNNNNSVLVTERLQNSTEFRCTVSNEVGYSRSRATVTVLSQPVIIEHPTDDDVPMRNSITLRCRSSGLGTLVYSWERRNSGSNWTTVSNDNTMSYTTDATLATGEYMYRCRVSDKAGSVVSNIAIVNVYGPPTITTHPVDQVKLEGMSTTLTCEGTGRGSITYQWESSSVKGERWISISNSNNARLDLQNLQRSHQYRCIVSNEAGGSISNPVLITVLRKSSPPNNLTITGIDVNSIQLIWFAPTHSHGRIDYYIVRYNRYEVNVTNFIGSYTLDNLIPYTEYSIHVTAVRIIGATGDTLMSEDSAVITERTLAGEPVIVALSHTSENKLILNDGNLDAETFIIDLPVISTLNGPFSHLYIIVALSGHVVSGIKDISTQELLQQSANMFPLFYITAVVNASQLIPGHRIRYILGAGDNTTDAEGHVFHNREVEIGFTYFFRVFSVNSTSENEISTTSDTQKFLAQPQDSSNSGSSNGINFSSLIIAVLAALLLALIIYSVVMTVWVFKSRKQRHQSGENTDSDNGHSIALEPTFKCKAVSKLYEVDQENPVYSSMTNTKDTANPAYLSITNTKELEKQSSSATNEKIENPAYSTITNTQDLDRKDQDSSVTNQKVESPAYELITNVKDLEKRSRSSSITNEEIENPAYMVTNMAETPAHPSVTHDQYNSEPQYESIPYHTVAKQ